MRGGYTLAGEVAIVRSFPTLLPLLSLLPPSAPSGPPTDITPTKVTSQEVYLVWKRPAYPMFASFIYVLYWGTARNDLEASELWCACVHLCLLCGACVCVCGACVCSACVYVVHVCMWCRCVCGECTCDACVCQWCIKDNTYDGASNH